MWYVHYWLSVIPKSVRAEDITENIGILDFELSEADIAAIDGIRDVPDPTFTALRVFTYIRTQFKRH